MNKIEIINQVSKVWEKAKTIYKIDGEAPKVEFFAEGKVAGKAYKFEHKISFNTVIAEQNSDEFIDTIIHEIAHNITFKIFPKRKQEHGPEFRSVCEKLGGSGKTKHRYKVDASLFKQVRYVYRCECQDHFLNGRMHTRTTKAKEINPLANVYCRKCSKVCLFTGLKTK